MDSFNVVAGVCSVLSFLMAAADWVRRRRKTKGSAKAKKKAAREATLTAQSTQRHPSGAYNLTGIADAFIIHIGPHGARPSANIAEKARREERLGGGVL